MYPEEVNPQTSQDYWGVSIRTWQRSSFLLLTIGVIGVGAAALSALTAPSATAIPGFWARFLPAVVYAFIGVISLANFFCCHHAAVIEGMKHEVVRQKIEAELNRELALLDPVTEVYNRRYLRAILSKEASRAKRYAKGLSVILTDITRFRHVNEGLGHAGGDVVLREIAHLLQTRIRNSDYIIRFGGDEFLLVLPDTDGANALMLARRIQASFTTWVGDRGLAAFDLRLAIGVATYADGQRVEETLAQAETRMKEDRRVGPATPVVEANDRRAAAKPTT